MGHDHAILGLYGGKGLGTADGKARGFIGSRLECQQQPIHTMRGGMKPKKKWVLENQKTAFKSVAADTSDRQHRKRQGWQTRLANGSSYVMKSSMGYDGHSSHLWHECGAGVQNQDGFRGSLQGHSQHAGWRAGPVVVVQQHGTANLPGVA